LRVACESDPGARHDSSGLVHNRAADASWQLLIGVLLGG
jgi:hypothetical protein